MNGDPDSINTIVGLTLVFCAFGLLGIGIMAYSDENRWRAFSSEHRCEIVARKEAANFETSRVAYKCDDGITYWR
jgi:hypothetical protein